MVKLNLGDNHPGWQDQKVKGWTTVDRNRDTTLNTEPEFNYDLRAVRYPWADGSVDAIYTSHFIEHLTHKDARHCIEECHRILRVGGVVRVVWPLFSYGYVPQMSLRDYLSGLKPPDDLNAEEMKVFLFCKGTHLYAYDLDTMCYELKRAGFARVERASWRHGVIARDDELAFLDGDRRENDFCVEAMK